ncbi:MAG TPA: hypothetical protein VK494_09425 [Gemmatimonadaceae bacterium]|nr:hypothetical protein [Gemmatimonadaceae bacterium]
MSNAAALTERLIQAAVDYESGRCGQRELSEARAAIESVIPDVAQAVGAPIGYAPFHPKHGWRIDLSGYTAQLAECYAMRNIESAAQQGWTIQPLYAAQPPAAPVEDDELIGLNARLSDALAEIRLLKTEILHRGSSAGNVDDDPTASEPWNLGCDFAMIQLCNFLGVQPTTVSWDAATETLDGDVQAVIGNILRAKFGEDWGPDHAPDEPQRSAGNAGVPELDRIKTTMKRLTDTQCMRSGQMDEALLYTLRSDVERYLSVLTNEPQRSAGNDTERAKAIVAEAWRQTCAGPGEFDDYAVPLIAAALSSAEPQAAADTIPVPKVALKWLFGEDAAADGKTFGEDEDVEIATPRKYSRRYWWRSRFRSMIPALAMTRPQSKTGEA